MANRYWVGGTGTWNTSSTTNWSASSGGGSGASAPTANDYVIFDANSGTGTVTLDYAYNYLPCAGVRKTTSNLSFGKTANTAGLNISASPTNTDAGKVLDITSSLSNNSSNVISISVNSLSNGGTYTIQISGSNNGVALQIVRSGNNQPTYSLSSSLQLYNAQFDAITFNSNNYSITTSVGNITFSGGGGTTTASYSLGSSVLTSSASVVLNAYASGTNISISCQVTASNLQINGNNGGTSYYGGTATLSNSLEISGTGALFGGNATIDNGILYAYQGPPNYVAGTITMQGASNQVFLIGTYSSLDLRIAGGTLSNVNGGATVARVGTLRFTGPSTTYTLNTNFEANTFIASGSTPGSMSITGNSTPKTFTVHNSFTLSNITWTNITAAGTIPFTGTGFVDNGGNTNIQFYVPGSGLFFGSNF